jgi:hypothetical protein
MKFEKNSHPRQFREIVFENQRMLGENKGKP